MKLFWFILVVLSMAFSLIGCASASTTTVSTPVPLDIKAIAELKEERANIFTLKLKKEDPLKPFESEFKAEYRDAIVSESEYNKYNQGDILSTQADVIGALFGDSSIFTSYTVRVHEKRIEYEYIVLYKDGTRDSIPAQVYQDALNKMQAELEVVSVPYANVTVTYALDKPLDQYTIIEQRSLKRHFIRVKIESTSLTFDVIKMLRNATTAHELIFEIPAEEYENTTDIWEPKLAVRSAILSGRLSTLRGTIIQKWTEEDYNFKVIRTKEGPTFVVPAK